MEIAKLTPSQKYDTKDGNFFIFYGDVQSGKTNKIFKLIDNEEFNLCVFFNGTNNALADQTNTRWKNKENAVFFEKPSSNINVQFNDDTKYIFKFAKTTKNYNYIVEQIDRFKDKKILIVNDESDYGDANHESLWGKKFYELWKKLTTISKKKSKIFFVSATPFVNIFSKTFPIDKIFIFPNGEGYAGIETTFNYTLIPNDKKIDSNYVKTIIDNITPEEREGIFLVENSYVNVNDNEDLSKELKKNNDLDVIDFYGNHKTIDLKGDKFRVIISGVYGSRGITFESLKYEICTNVTKSTKISTILQLCRWFGYSKYRKQPDKIQIFITNIFKEKLDIARNCIEIIKKYNDNVQVVKSMLEQINHLNGGNLW